MQKDTNIALLFFGQLRWIDNPHTSSSHNQFIINRYNTDVFGNFWDIDKNLSILPHSGHVDSVASPSDINAPIKIQKQYNFTKIRFDEIRDFDFKQILLAKVKAKDWPNFRDADWFNLQSFNNILSQFYSIQRVSRLFRDYIEENLDKRYDFIILSRPDICIWDYPNLDKLEKGWFYLSNHFNHFPDLSFIFDVKYLSTFTNLYDNLIKITDEELYSLWGPTGEALKYNSYRKYFPNECLRGIQIPVRIVRGMDCRGTQW